MTTVELVPELVMFAKEHSTNDIEIHCADFIKLTLKKNLISLLTWMDLV